MYYLFSHWRASKVIRWTRNWPILNTNTTGSISGHDTNIFSSKLCTVYSLKRSNKMPLWFNWKKIIVFIFLYHQKISLIGLCKPFVANFLRKELAIAATLTTAALSYPGVWNEHQSRPQNMVSWLLQNLSFVSTCLYYVAQNLAFKHENF